MISTVTKNDLSGSLPVVSDAERDKLWEASGKDVHRFLRLLQSSGYADSRLAGQVNLMVHMLERGHELGWLTWDEMCDQTGLTYETLRKLRVIVREMQVRTRHTIADTFGWTRESIDAMLAGGTPVLAAGWRPHADPPPAAAPEDVDLSPVLIELGLSAEDLAIVEDRYLKEDPPTRLLAAAVAQALSAGIDPRLRDHLLKVARDTTTRALAEERNGPYQLRAMLETLGPGMVQERDSALQ
jgi:hypothetical protein